MSFHETVPFVFSHSVGSTAGAGEPTLSARPGAPAKKTAAQARA